jgi:Asp-tRNA(Asn)/Glu-tRNA(Gln) amidotransferase C subunit
MTQQSKVYLSDLHFEHTQWLSELKFWDEEIATFTKKLEEVVGRYTENDNKIKIEHFQNKFLVNHQAILNLIKAVNKHERVLAQYAESHLATIENTPLHDHSDLREQVEVQRQIYVDLKKEYYKFLTHKS